jgi:pimeloyl-ACP methyl ester carboxylesterase
MAITGSSGSNGQLAREDHEGLAVKLRNALRSAGRSRRRLGVVVARRFGFLWRCIGPAGTVRQSAFRCSAGIAARLLVFLPGIGDMAEDYEQHGFIDTVRKQDSDIDMIVADLHFGYYLRRSIVERLREDIVHPARNAGYKQIALVGTSLGGLGSLLYAMEHPDEISQLYLLAPYLGNSAIISEIHRAGGVNAWQPGQVDGGDFQRRLWRWIKSLPAEVSVPQIHLGFGAQDSFAPANRLLADSLPSHRVYTTPGRHDWRTWSALWQSMAKTLGPENDG